MRAMTWVIDCNCCVTPDDHEFAQEVRALRVLWVTGISAMACCTSFEIACYGSLCVGLLCSTSYFDFGHELLVASVT